MPAAQAPVQLALLGTGQVGRAVLQRLSCWSGEGFAAHLALVHVANSRIAATLIPSPSGRGDGMRIRPDAITTSHPHPPFEHLLPAGERKRIVASDLGSIASVFGGDALRIVIDATASDEVAARQAEWLSRGIHVVTACKLGQGTSLARWHAIRAACARSGACYGDSATVGAGLPLLRSLRELRSGGDRIHAIAGVLSGSLAWLFHHYDGVRPFSALVRQARDAGYTEPDPRDDLSGEDVRRKLLILARAAGVELDADDVEVESLVPAALAMLPREVLDAGLPQLDAVLRTRHADAHRHGANLRFVARLEEGRARVGLEALAAGHPLAGGSDTDNRVAIWSDRYAVQPLVVQGPGAGADVTAAALLDDVLAIASGAARSARAA